MAQNALVSADPVNFTPHVLDGSVESIVQVGDTVVLGGAFTQVQAASGGPILTRSNVVAFSASTGAISTTFAPIADAEVTTVLAAADGRSVYLAGFFDKVNGTVAPNLARVSLADGTLVPGFRARSMTGRIKDLRLAGGRLWAAGTFGTVAGNAQPALTTLNPDTGDFDPYMSLQFAGPRNGGDLQVMKMDVTPDGSRLIAMGNFSTVDGASRPQLVMLDLSGSTARLANWATQVYNPQCSLSFDSYLRDVDFSPDGSYFVVTTTGAYGGNANNNPCDSNMRWETGATGAGLTPTWINYTGGDTTYAVAVTGGAVYVGGHFRWSNNPFAGDRAGQGAVAREGIAALDPANGLPLSWNPGRTKGVGVFDLLATATGLWVGSDTDRIGNDEYHGRIAYFPLAGGTALPANATGSLPGTVYLASGTGANAGALRAVPYDGVRASAPTVVPGTGVSWGSTRGSVMIDGNVYSGYSDGTFSRRAFDGSSFGQAVPVNGGDQLVVNTNWHTDVSRITGMFFARGRLYYTMSNSTSLFYRGLATESGVVGALRYTASGNVSGIDFSRVSGMFLAGGKLYFASSLNGTLNRIDWSGSAPVAGTAKVVGGPAVDGIDWRSTGLFVKVLPPVAPNQQPAASWRLSCTQLDCVFDGSASTDPDGTIASYAWDFGDGTTGTGVNPSHRYASAGEYQVSLTVTDNRGGQNTAVQSVTVAAAPVAAVGFVGVSAANGNLNSYQVTVPQNVVAGDALVLLATTGTTVSVPDPTGVSGWQQISSVSMGGTNGTTTVWSKVAAAGDAGTPVTVTPSALAKTGVTLLAYTGTDTTDPVSVVQAAAETLTVAGHTTPAVSVPTAGSLVVSYWADRSTTTAAWTAPAGDTLRSQTFGPGGGHISTLITDSGTPVPMGNRAGLTATADSASARASMVSIVLRAKGAALPNQLPTASSSVSCTLLDCAFGGSASTDPDGTIASYAWDFGDGTTGTGVSATHSYASSGVYQVSLTVTDNRGGQNTASRSVTVAAAPAAFVGVSAVNANSTSFQVTVPQAVVPGDALVLLATTGTTVSVSDPTGVSGWQQISAVPMGGTNGTTTVWSKVAGVGDAGKTVTVTLSAAAKAGVTLLAYTGTATTNPVSVVQAAAETLTVVGHTTPGVSVPTAGSLVVSYWADRSSLTTSWTPPAGDTLRSQTFGLGGGHISTLITDSGTGVPMGDRAGLTATADSASPRAGMVSIVLAQR